MNISDLSTHTHTYIGMHVSVYVCVYTYYPLGLIKWKEIRSPAHQSREPSQGYIIATFKKIEATEREK